MPNAFFASIPKLCHPVVSKHSLLDWRLPPTWSRPSWNSYRQSHKAGLRGWQRQVELEDRVNLAASSIHLKRDRIAQPQFERSKQNRSHRQHRCDCREHQRREHGGELPGAASGSTPNGGRLSWRPRLSFAARIHLLHRGYRQLLQDHDAIVVVEGRDLATKPALRGQR